MSRIAIVIVGFRCAEAIATCLDRLAQSIHRDFEVHVIENGGDASFAALLKCVSPHEDPAPAPGAQADPSGRIVETRELQGGGGQRVLLHRASGNLGYAGGINAVIDRIASDPSWSAIWILNPDTEPEPDALAALVRKLADGHYGIIGSRMVLKGEGHVQMYAGRWRPWLARGYNIGRGRPVADVPDVQALEQEMDYVCGASMLVRRDYVDTVGLMREDYFLYAEEVDWCFRRGPYKLGYAHDSVVLHDQGAIIGTNVDRRVRSGFSVFLDERAKLLFTRRFFPYIYPFVTVSALLLTMQYLKARAFDNFRHALAGWWAGIRGETGFPNRFNPR